jgi:hypothetical protein
LYCPGGKRIPGKLTYWTLSEEGRGGSIPEDGKNRACAAY